MLNYGYNLIKLLFGHRHLKPRLGIYYVTAQCNFNCTYCEDFGRPRNLSTEDAYLPQPLAEAQRILAVLRQGVDCLMLTGGEPLLYPHLLPLVTYARRELRFRQITLTTNGWLLPQAEGLLPLLDRLIISLDAADPEKWSGIIRTPLAAQAVLENIERYAARQKKDRFRLIINAVLTPQTLPEGPALLDFCARHKILISFSPQAVCNWPRYDLVTHPGYRPFITHVMAVKRRGGPVLGSMAYWKTLLNLQPYSCYPTLTPRVLPNGDLTYPCRPIEKSGHSHGGRPCNLREVSSWQEARQAAARQYGPPPRVCSSCFQQCFAESSLMQAQPLSLLKELILYSPSRQADLSTYAPG